MAVDYSEHTAPEGDLEGEVLETLSGGEPYIFIVSALMPNGELSLRLAVGAGLSDTGTVRNILTKTLAALPEAK